MKYLILCAIEEPPENHGMYNRMTPRGATEHAFPMYAEDGSEGGLRNEEVRGWTVESEASIQAVAEQMTRNFPGKNVEVYALQAVHVRQVGEMESKTVDKNGILPKKG